MRRSVRVVVLGPLMVAAMSVFSTVSPLLAGILWMVGANPRDAFTATAEGWREVFALVWRGDARG